MTTISAKAKDDLERLLAQGRGQGVGANYKAFVRTSDGATGQLISVCHSNRHGLSTHAISTSSETPRNPGSKHTTHCA